MSSPLLLEGHVFRDETPALRREIERLVEELRAERRKTAQIEAGVRELRKDTLPLYRALQKVHGDIEEMGLGDSALVGSNGKWDAIKQRLAPRLVEAINILLVQRSMKRTQLAAAMKMDYSNCTKNVIAVLLRQGLMVENGRELQLKELL